MKTFEKFIRSRNGILSFLAVLVILLLVFAYSSGILGGLTGTAGVSYPMPPNGYTCLPNCVENDPRMFILAGSNQNNLSTQPIRVWIMVPGDQPTFTMGIFDGDTSKDINNKLNIDAKGAFINTAGNWDDATSGDTTYTLYADPLADGSGQIVLSSWMGNDVMLNNAWWEVSINNDDQAKATNGHYYYRLEAMRPAGALGGQAFKVRASGYLMTGLNQEWPVGLAAKLVTPNDLKIIYPQSKSVLNLGPSTYNGDWSVYFEVSSDTQQIEIWDGDFDRGSKPNLDTDDLNSVGRPTWTTLLAVDEGVGATTSTQKDDSTNAANKVSPAIYYEILNPNGQSIYVDNNPSGTKEWEVTSLSTDPADNPDFLTSEMFTAGMYRIHIVGLDLQNNIWLSVNYPICDPNGGCPPMPTDSVAELSPEPVCTAGNTYTIENAISDPFYGVKFNYSSGTEVKDGGFDTFKYTLPTDVVAAMSNMQVEVMTADGSRTYELVCAFNNPLGCGGAVSDEVSSVSFDGAVDNGDGTSTLTFHVYVYQNSLISALFSLPDGQMAGNLTDSFTSEICVAP